MCHSRAERVERASRPWSLIRQFFSYGVADSESSGTGSTRAVRRITAPSKKIPWLERLEQREVLSTFFVSLSGNDANPGTAVAPFRTIQKAIAETALADAANDTIQVEAGTYNSAADVQISIPASANINNLQVTAGWDVGSTFTTRTPRSTVYVPQQPGSAVAADVDVFADNVAIDGFHFVFDGTTGVGGTRQSAGILSRGNSFTLNDNLIEVGSSSAAGAFDAYGFQTIFGNLNNGTITLTRNEFQADAQHASGAIYLNPGAATAITVGGSVALGNTVSGTNLSQGIVADGISNVTITGNTLSRTGPVAGAQFQQLIYAGPFNGSANQTAVVIDSNTLNAGDIADSIGIEIGNTSGNGFTLLSVQVTGNQVQDSTVGILVTDNAQNATIQGGQITSNVLGIFATTSDPINAPIQDLTLSGVQVTNNTNDGFRGTDLSGVVTINGGIYSNNAADGIDVDGDNVAGTRLILTGSVDASGNGDDGLFATQFPSGGTSPHVSITGGTFNNNGTATSTGDGIHLVAVGDVATNGVTANGNDPGLLVSGAASFSDTDGVYSNNDDHGIQLIDIAGAVTLTRTNADNNDADADLVGDGVNATASANPQAIGGALTISGGMFRDTDAAGAAVSQRNGVFVASVAGTVTLQNSGVIPMTVTGNRADGVNITGVGTNSATLTNGTYSNNGDDGIDLDNFATVTLNAVTASGNGDRGFEVSNVSGTLFLSDLTLGPAPNPNGSGFGGDATSVNTIDFTTTTTPANVSDTVSITSTQFQHTRAGVAHQPVTYSTVPNLTVHTLDGSDTINVDSTNAATTTTVNAGAGNDIINVGNGTLDGIAGPLFVNGDGNDATPTTTLSVTCDGTTISNTLADGDTLNLNDQLDPNPSTYTLTATTFQRTGTALVTYGTVETVTLNAGTGSDTINVSSTAASLNTTVNTTAGGDAVAVTTTGATSNTVINGDGSANTITITSTGAGSVTQANGGGGADIITLDNHGAGSGVQLSGDSGSDTIHIRATSATGAVLANGGAGNDTINIGSTTNSLDAILGVVCVNGNSNDASPTTTLTVSCNGTVTNTLESGDVLNLNDQGDANPSTYTLTATTFQRTGTAQITYTTIESLTLNAGTGSDTITVTSTANSANTTINTTAGGDAVNVTTTGSSSNVVINGDGSSNAITIATTGSGSITQVNAGGGLDTISVNGTGNNSGVDLNGSADGDTFHIRATGSGSRTLINGGAGNDVTNVGSAGNSLDTIVGDVCVNGDGHDGLPDVTLTVTCDGVPISNTLDAGDVLNVNDQGNAVASTYTVTAATVQRGGTGLITYGTVESVTLNAGTGGDTINVNSTAASVNTTIQSTSGGDAVNVTTTGASSNVVINGDAAANAITIGTTGTSSVMQVNAAGGSDVITLNGSGNNSGVELNGSTDSDTIHVRSTGTGGATVVNAGPNNDTINVGSAGNSLDNILGVVCINGDTHDALPTTSLTCGVSTNTLPAGDTLNFNDSADPSNNSYTLTSTTLNRTGMAQITYLTVETINLNAGTGVDTITVSSTVASGNTTVNANSGGDTVTVAGTGAGSSVVINGDAGNDTVNVQNTAAGSITVVQAGADNDTMNIGSVTLTLDGILGAVCAKGEAGTDILHVNDNEDTTGDIGTLTPTTITGISPGVINYETVESLVINLGRAPDNFTITNTHAGNTQVNAGQAVVPTGGNDDVIVISNSTGTTIVDGQNGNDSITSGPGSDVLIGGPGSPPPNGIQGDTDQDGVLDLGEIWTDRDTLTCGAGSDVIFFTPVEDTVSPDCSDAQQFSEGKSPKAVIPSVPFVGDATSEVIIGTPGPDDIDGAGGDDFIVAGAGNDIVVGGDGNDTVRGGADDDVISGGTGNDGLFGGSGDDRLNGEAGKDFLEGGFDDDTLDGGSNDDVLSDLFGGNDSLNGRDGNDTLLAGPGNDTLRGEAGADVLLDSGLLKVSIFVNANDPEFLLFTRGGGDDDMDGADGNDTINGGPGDDMLRGGSGDDIIVDVFMEFYVSEDEDHDGVLDPGEDRNGNGFELSFKEDINGNGQLDLVVSEDVNGNGQLDAGEDINGNGRIDFVTEDFNASSFSGAPLGNVPDLSRFGAFQCSTALPAFVLACPRPQDGGNDTLDGGAGDDTLAGGTGRDSILGGPGADFLMGALLADEHALASSEQFDSFDRDDTLDAGAGDGKRDVLVDVSDSRKKLNDGRRNTFRNTDATDIVISRFTRSTLFKMVNLRTELFGNSVFETCTVRPGRGRLTSPVCDPINVKPPSKTAIRDQVERFTSGFGFAMQNIIGLNPLGKSKGRAIGPQPAPVPVSFEVPDASALDSLLDSILKGE